MVLNGYNVGFGKIGISVGCQTATYAQVLRVAKWLVDKGQRLKPVDGGKRITELLPSHKGKWFTASIRGERVYGRIQRYCDDWYLCQDSMHGAACGDKLGFAFSRYVRYAEGSGSVKGLTIYKGNPYPDVKRCRELRGGKIVMVPGFVYYNGHKLTNKQVAKLAKAATKHLKKKK